MIFMSNNPIYKLLERMSDENNLKVHGINVYLKWETGSDLDIQVKCGCDKLHGYGTRSFKCDTCDMEQDHFVKTG